MDDRDRRRAAVIGVGNPLYGDDGFGPRALEALRGEAILEGIDLVDGASLGVGLLEYLTDYRAVIIIDAARMGLPPGTVRVFTPDEVRSMERGAGLSLHSTDILGVIDLGRALGEELADISVVAVEPEALAMGEGLSVAVEKAIGTALAEVRRILAGK